MAKPGPQAGITNRPPEHLLLAGFNFTATDKASVTAALEALRGVVRAELDSQLDPAETETGELGFADGYDRAHLTITLGLAASAYDHLEVAEGSRPADLRPIHWADLVDAPPTTETAGDLVLQICADNLYICEHVVRRVQHDLADKLQLLATFIGSQRYNSRPGRTSKREGRALIGFLDGTSNLDPRNSEDDAALVFVDPGAVADYPPNPPQTSPDPSPYGGGGDSGPHFPELHPVPTSEPDWTRDGTYMTLRVSSFPADGWDAIAQGAQEQDVGRYKRGGASLDLAEDASPTDPPAFEANKEAPGVALTAHIRKANPRGPGDDQRRIFRRGYPLIAGGTGDLQRGLIFIAFARTITTQFEFITRAWIRNPNFPRPDAGIDALLDQQALKETILGGGYYFVPPLEHKTQPWTWLLPAS
jgi:deferrochelatase/peroxidase EfeB